MEGSRIAEEYPELENKVSQEQTYIDLNKKSYDIYTASHKAISEYAKVLNILSFYNLIEAWNIQDISWVVVNVSNRYNVLLKSKDLYSTYDYMEGANGIFKSSRELDKNEKGILKTKLLAKFSDCKDELFPVINRSTITCVPQWKFTTRSNKHWKNVEI